MRSKGIAVIVVVLLAITLAIPSTSHAWRGWWGPGVFAGGVLVGAAVAGPWYAPPPPVYVYPYPAPPQVVYAAPPPGQAYAYPPPASPPPDAAAAPQGKGQWVDVPGQMVNNIWVPPHKAWAPEGP